MYVNKIHVYIVNKLCKLSNSTVSSSFFPCIHFDKLTLSIQISTLPYLLFMGKTIGRADL